MNIKECNQETYGQKFHNQKRITKEAMQKSFASSQANNDNKEIDKICELHNNFKNLDENQLKEYYTLNNRLKKDFVSWKRIIEEGYGTHPKEKMGNEKGKNKEKQNSMKYHFQD